MAVSHTEAQTSDFPSHPSGNKLKCVDEDEEQQLQFQDTVPFEDTFVLDSQSMEETQLLDHSDFGDETGTGMHEYEEEVVLDSEDEEVNGSRILTVKAHVLSNQKLSLHHLQCGPGGKDEGSPPLARLNYIGSQEPGGESSPANALDFVDHFVSLNDDLGGSPGIDHRKTIKEKSPPVSRTKGSQRLARMIKLESQIERAKTFEWVDPPEEHGGVYLFNKKIQSSIDFVESHQRSIVGHQKFRFVDDNICISSGGESKGRKIIQSLHKEITESEEKIENEIVNDLEEQLDTKLTGLQSEASAIGTDIVDMFDVGFNTQIAAEAMEALAYGDHLDCNSADAYQGMENTADVVSGGATKNTALLEHPSLPKSDFPKIGAINMNAKRRKRSTRTVKRRFASSQKQSQSRELDPDLAAQTTVKRSRFFSEYSSNSADANGNLCRESPKPTKNRKLERATGESNLRVLENNLSSPISAGRSLLGKGQSQGHCKNYSSVSNQTRQSKSGDKLLRTEDGPNNPGERMNNVTEDGIIKYRRKKRCLNAHPSETIRGVEGGSNESVERTNNDKKDDIITYRRKKRISAKENCPKLCVSSEGDRDINASSLILDLWSHPKGKRTRLNARGNSHRTTVFFTPFSIVDGKDSCSPCDEMPECCNDIKGKAQSLLFYCCPPQHSSNKDSDRTLPALQSGQLDSTDPTSLVDVKSQISVVLSGSEHTAPSNSTTGINVGSSKYLSHDYHRKPFKKNLPKSSLLKELIGLGIPESIMDFTWKDLRRRRNMAYVRVLFSQHLDDDIIKQQKKVIARLGLSIASCSIDATHFVADQFARTRNMLEFIALGKPVVTHLWLESCGQANCLISEKSYILRDAKKEKEIGFSMLVSLDCAKRCPLLKGRNVFITPNIKPDREMMISLVKAVQGQPVEKVQIPAAKDKKSLEDLLILSCEEDRTICLPLVEKGAAVYSSELVLNGIVIQRLEYKRHRLFTALGKRNRP
ncbi:PREDICTED: mediator of DNA damage [Prunus dulcis]|uniref:PREDICTED: mediator of DNA damage n=1 Tax=Prunus dulcis TaxID=3755 RepID=A0A5E4EF99_PRUDU|nr:uncharacterized protein LOC117636632 isoform X1 [Prunus dulcis]KAI5316079.1 hypothetical protein L3X38_045255 [Prunus dulcis]VVA14092.1 PREDICTED: mediator of DNA damage [Prunus dulcis]